MQGLGDYRLDPPDGVDFADVVRHIVYQSVDEIDQVLELLDDLDREYRDVGADDFRYALVQIVELIQRWYPDFKRSDRLADYRKALAAKTNLDMPKQTEIAFINDAMISVR